MTTEMLTLDSNITAVEVEKRGIKLSLAIRLVDDYTDRSPIGSIKVFIKEITKISDGEKEFLKGIKNLSGDYLFFDILDGGYTVCVESKYYLEEEKNVTLHSSSIEMSIKLKPNPAYPFPSRTTLIRGLVKTSDDNPVSGATVKLVGKEMVNNRSDERGEFVLYFKGLKGDDVDSNGFIEVANSTELELEITSDSTTKKESIGKVKIGEVKSVGVIKLA